MRERERGNDVTVKHRRGVRGQEGGADMRAGQNISSGVNLVTTECLFTNDVCKIINVFFS